MCRGFALCFVAFLATSLCFGQGRIGSSVTGSAQSASYNATFTTSTTQYNSPGVTGAPYSAEQVQQRVQTLADNLHITQSNGTQRMWRDSQGRTRTERPMGTSLNANAPQMPVIVEIRDPVAGFAYILDTQGKVAHRITLQPMPNRTAAVNRISAPAPAPAFATGGSAAMTISSLTRPGAPTAATATAAAQRAAAVDPNQPKSTSESLGSQVIEGVLAQGTRTSIVYPVGSQGNDRPFSVISESWYSQELRASILQKSSDPRSGDNITKLTNISRNEPDLLLFMPPADYTIVDEAGPQVTIRYTMPRQ